MRTDTNRSVSVNRNILSNVNFGHIEEELIDNYPILVRGVISEIGGFGEASDELADILVSKYPTFVRGVIESFHAGDIDESNYSGASIPSNQPPTSRSQTINTDQSRAMEPSRGKRWSKNRRRQNKRYDA